MFCLFPDDIQLTTDLCDDDISNMESTALKTVCLLPGKDVTLFCALPDAYVIWSSPDLGMQEIHGSSAFGMLGSKIQLEYNSFDANSMCIRTRATIVDIDKTMNGLEITCATFLFAPCRSIFSTTFTVNVIGKKL